MKTGHGLVYMLTTSVHNPCPLFFVFSYILLPGYVATINVPEPINARCGFGCGDKHSVVDSDTNSTKHNNVNIGCKDITLIISRYFRTAGTWRGVFEPSTAASDE